MRTVSLSGWGQPADTLHEISPGTGLDYASSPNAYTALKQLKIQADEAECIIGWSLGGQLAVRAVAAGMLKPKALILIATPFQFVATPERKLGMPPDLFQTFRNNYSSDAVRTLGKAWASILKGDSRASAIRPKLEKQDRETLAQKPWLHWLDELNAFTCDSLHLADFPPTLLIHGNRDAVVYHEQSIAFQEAIPQAQLFTIEGCGHAPHWHNRALIIKTIRDFTA